jgi:5'-3' exonuclease
MGDKGDNVFGIKGCGEVTADQLVRIFANVEEFFDKWEEWVADGGLQTNKSLNRARTPLLTAVQDPATRERILVQNRKLMDLKTLYGDKALAAAIRKTPGRVDREQLRSHLSRLAFFTIVNDMERWLAPFVK